MSHNDEGVFYLATESTDINIIPNHIFDSPRLILVRPVFEIETNLLNTQYQGPIERECEPPTTQVLDALFEFSAYLNIWKQFPHSKENLLNQAISHFASSYYDAMSATIPQAHIWLIHEINNHFNLDQNKAIYPKANKETWFTIEDFLKSTHKNASIPETLGIIIKEHL